MGAGRMLFTLALVAFSAVIVENIARHYKHTAVMHIAKLMPYFLGGAIAMQVSHMSKLLFGSTSAIWLGTTILISLLAVAIAINIGKTVADWMYKK